MNRGELLHAIYTIDPEAFEYLINNHAKDIHAHEPGETLSTVMVWEQTPQGHLYWEHINRELLK